MAHVPCLDYQQTVPYTRQPLADIAEINHFIALRQQVACPMLANMLQ